MVSGGSLPASGKPRRMPSAGAASASSSAVAAIANTHGRRWTDVAPAGGRASASRPPACPACGRGSGAAAGRRSGPGRRAAREQADRRDHHDQHRERSRERDAVHVREAGEAEAEHGDHHGRAGDDHAAPGRGHGLDHRVVAVLALLQRRAEAGDDQQRVVDADADPDQAGHRRRPVGNVDDVGEQDDQAARGDAEADQRDQRAGARRPPPSRTRSAARSPRRGSRGPQGWPPPVPRRSGRRRA